MTHPSSRDLQALSAYLDGQVSQPDRKRLEARIAADPQLASALDELRQTRTLLRRTPKRRAPRNFTLTPKMAGIRPPVPRLVPVLSWGSAVAALFFIFTLGASLIGQLSFGMAAATSAAAPMGAGAALPAATAISAEAVPMPMAPVAAAPATQAPATEAPANILANSAPATNAPATEVSANVLLATEAPATPAPTVAPSLSALNPPPAAKIMPTSSTEQAAVMSVEQATPAPAARVVQAPKAAKAPHRPVDIWLIIWPGLAVLLAISAALMLWANKRAFQRKNAR